MAYAEQLQLAGLSKDQAALYETLIKNGPLPASKAARFAGVSRTLSYKVLDELREKGLVTREDPKGAVSMFVPAHPMKLKEKVDERVRDTTQATTALDGVFNQMVSDFNLVSGKPGVRFFEGKDGIWTVLEDSLHAQEVIYSYADVESVEKYIPEMNDKYSALRERGNVRKDVILLDTEATRTFLRDYKPGVTEARILPTHRTPYQTIMQIYDNKVSYITLTEERHIGVIIADPHMYALHRYLFEFIWTTATVPVPVGA